MKNERQKRTEKEEIGSDVDTDIVRENYPEIISETARLARVKGEHCERRTGGEEEGNESNDAVAVNFIWQLLCPFTNLRSVFTAVDAPRKSPAPV